MSVVEYITSIKKKTNVNHNYDMASVNVCKTHGVKPNFVFLNKKKDWVVAECQSEECSCFAYECDIVSKWNLYNPQN